MKNKHMGSDFDDFLREEDLLEVAEFTAAKQVWALVESGAASWSGGKPTGSNRRPQTQGKGAPDIVLEDLR